MLYLVISIMTNGLTCLFQFWVEKNFLLKNNFGVFHDITNDAGLEAPYYSFPCWIWDVNNDGFNDIFVASYDSRNLLNLATDFS